MGGSSSKSAPVVKNCVVLYKTDFSPASRAVMMALDAINVRVHQCELNLYSGQHKTPAFSQINPIQTVPVLQDQELTIWDSHAITQYLVTRYAKEDRLYPKEPKQRSQVDQYLHFDSSILYPRFKATAYPVIFQNQKFISPEVACQVDEAYSLLEYLLCGKECLTLNRITIADICCAATVSTLHIMIPVEPCRYPNLAAWMFKISQECFYRNYNLNGLAEFECTYKNVIFSPC